MNDAPDKDKLQKAIDYWVAMAENDLDSAQVLFENGRYGWSLFLSHLVLEKTLKALWIKRNNDIVVPRIHNLVRLAETCRLELNETDRIELATITEFNMETRYPEEQKSFMQRCTLEFTAKYFGIIEKWRKAILKQLKKS